MAQSKRSSDSSSSFGGFQKSAPSRKFKSLKQEEHLGKRFAKSSTLKFNRERQLNSASNS